MDTYKIIYTYEHTHARTNTLDKKMRRIFVWQETEERTEGKQL